MTNVTKRSPPKGTEKVCMGRTNVTKRSPPSLGHIGGAEWVPKGNKKVCMGMTNVTKRSPPPLAWSRWGCRMGPKRVTDNIDNIDILWAPTLGVLGTRG